MEIENKMSNKCQMTADYYRQINGCINLAYL